MQQIQAWLKTGDYNAGVKLYEQHGNNGFLKKQFAKGFTSFNDFTLRAELSKLVRGSGVEVRVTAPPQNLITPNSGELKKPAIEMSTSSMNETSSSELKTKYLQLCKKRDRLYLELNIHMGERHHLPEGFLLHDCAKSILTKHQQLTEIWVLIDHYQVHQKFPAEITPPEKPVMDPEKEIQLLRAAISKANTRLKNENCRDRDKTTKTRHSNQTRLNELLAKRDVK